MNTSNTIKALLNLCGKRQVDLASYLGMVPQSLNNKMSRNSWSAKDLQRVAEFTGCKCGFVLPDGNTLFFSEK